MSTGFFQMNDVMIRNDLWVPITIRVAWDIYMARIEVRPNILTAAQIHVLSHLPSDVTVDKAERLAGVYTQDFIKRYTEQRYEMPSWDMDFEAPFSLEYRSKLLARSDKNAHRVFWLMYSDGLSMQKVAQKISKPVRTVEKICSVLRTHMRGVAAEMGLDIQSWNDTRVDRAISFVGTLATGEDLNLDELGTSAGKKYTRRCPRLRRAHYLLRKGVLSLRDLSVPDDHQFVPRRQMLALRLHPDAKKYAKNIEEALGDSAVSVEQQGHAWLIDGIDIEDAEVALRDLAYHGTPAKQYVRGAMVSGPGDWFENFVLGPLPMRCLDAVRSKTWGDVDGMDELPVPLPPPPKATQWWMAAAMSTLLSLTSIAWAIETTDSGSTAPLDAEFDAYTEFVDVRFDLPDDAHVAVVRLKGGILQIDGAYTPITKGRLSTGDGRFILRVDAPRIAVISSSEPITDLDILMQAAQVNSDPMDALEQQVLAKYPTADVVVSPLAQGY